MDSYPPPDARTSHLRTLSKIVEPASAPRSVPEGKVPEGAAHHTVLFGYVNTFPGAFSTSGPGSYSFVPRQGARIVHGNNRFGKGSAA
jgi:hypothetical protein